MKVRSPNTKLRIVVLGYVIRFPLGGMTWHYLNYVLGLMQMGHDVYFLEDSDDYEECCFDPVRLVNGPDPSYGISYASALFERVGAGKRWAYYDAHAQEWKGPCAAGINEILSSAEVLINVSGSNPLRPWHMKVPIRLMIDTDPGFEQVRQLTEPLRRERTLKHTHFFTFGENIERGSAAVPDDGLRWRATRQPIVLERWPLVELPRDAKFTTVMQWDSYPSREFNGKEYGTKSRSFVPFMDFPLRARGGFELAVSGTRTPRSKLKENGWTLKNPYEVTRDPWLYQDFIRGSAGEFSVAKHGYVASRAGWFSERSACYLATGRPVVTQDTGFSEWLPTGAGLFSFGSPDEAVAAVETIRRDPERHSKAARELAAEYFDANKVLNELLERLTAA